MSEMPREQLNAMAIKSDLLKRALETWNLKNLNLETVRLYVFSMPALRLAFVGYLTLFAPMLPVSS